MSSKPSVGCAQAELLGLVVGTQFTRCSSVANNPFLRRPSIPVTGAVSASLDYTRSFGPKISRNCQLAAEALSSPRGSNRKQLQFATLVELVMSRDLDLFEANDLQKLPQQGAAKVPPRV
jgi:hypothetical protein